MKIVHMNRDFTLPHRLYPGYYFLHLPIPEMDTELALNFSYLSKLRFLNTKFRFRDCFFYYFLIMNLIFSKVLKASVLSYPLLARSAHPQWRSIHSSRYKKQRVSSERLRTKNAGSNF